VPGGGRDLEQPPGLEEGEWGEKATWTISTAAAALGSKCFETRSYIKYIRFSFMCDICAYTNLKRQKKGMKPENCVQMEEILLNTAVQGQTVESHFHERRT
jgi:hypothetical protein